MDIGSVSIRGRVREKDEDSVFYHASSVTNGSTGEESGLFVLADGMGGGEEGEIASKIAVDVLKRNAEIILSGTIEDSKERLVNAVREANMEVISYKHDHGFSEMGTTITACVYRDSTIIATNVGDSRTYLLHDGRISQRTVDHSFVQELVMNGLITEDQARVHPRRNEISNALGFNDDLKPDVYVWKAFNEDYVLLCCDGMWEPIHHLIGEISAMKGSCMEKVRMMAELANEMDGSDNISAILFSVNSRNDFDRFIRKPTLSVPQRT